MHVIFISTLIAASILPAPAQQSLKRSDPPSTTTPSASGKGSSQGSATKVQHTTSFHVTVHVNATQDVVPTETGTSFHASAQIIEDSAGTYGDLSRYLQLLPGVAFNSDESNDVLVRGGNPIENLYLVDGIPIPNINHIATQGTTGGLVSMIDTSAISNIDFLTGGYDARYDERLSSVIKIRTRDVQGPKRFREAEMGFVGAGMTSARPIGHGGGLLMSAHRSMLNLFTDNIGLNGVPIYTNALMHLQMPLSPFDSLSILSLGGIDSINIKPEAYDNFETNTINTQYRGWRFTNGFQWQHTYSEKSFGTLALSDSENHEDIHQQDQLVNNTMPAGYTRATLPATPVYSQDTHDGISDLKYDYHREIGKRVILLTGTDARVHHVDYNVAQPIGEQTPLSTDPARSDATSFAPHFWIGETGSYLQGSLMITPRWSIGAGTRLQTFAFGGHTTLTPRFNTRYRLTNRIAAHFSFGEYAQMPPYIYLTAYSTNRAMIPIRNRQLVAGLDFLLGTHGKITLNGYRKIYRDYPVSTEYPTLSLANMIDTLGQQFIWLPMVSRGTGRAEGIELALEERVTPHLLLMGNAAYARNQFAGLDGILHPGNFDFPVIANLAGEYRPGRKYAFSFSYKYSSGRPYTPFLLNMSVEQNRPIYDLSKVNAMRGPYYSRLDFLVNRNFMLGGRILTIYGGLENALNRKNFLAYAWKPRVGYYGLCKSSPQACISEQSQMGIFPNVGVRFRF